MSIVTGEPTRTLPPGVHLVSTSGMVGSQIDYCIMCNAEGSWSGEHSRLDDPCPMIFVRHDRNGYVYWKAVPVKP